MNRFDPSSSNNSPICPRTNTWIARTQMKKTKQRRNDVRLRDSPYDLDKVCSKMKSAIWLLLVPGLSDDSLSFVLLAPVLALFAVG